MVELARTKVLEDARLLMPNILVSLVNCPYQVGLFTMNPFLVSILVDCSL